MKCKIYKCEGKAKTILGDNTGVCVEHFNVRVIKCIHCYAKRSVECAYGYSKPRWTVICGDRKCSGNVKHEWEATNERTGFGN